MRARVKGAASAAILAVVVVALLVIRGPGDKECVEVRLLASDHDPVIAFLFPAATARPTAGIAQTSGGRLWAVVRASEIGLRPVRLVLPDGRADGVRLEADWHRWGNFLLQLEITATRPPENARLHVGVDGRPRVTPETWGSQLDVRMLGERLQASLAERMSMSDPTASSEVVVPVPTRAVRPRVVAADLQVLGISRLLASFLTSYENSSSSRAANIRLAAAAIDGKVLYPGEEFSFNAAVGPRNVEQGYREAPVIVNDKLISGLGGGICQVSTTLYNAALLAGLTVVERTPHSLPSSYVEPGRDATVAYGLLDLRLRNDLGFPILLSALAREGILRVSFHGPRTGGDQQVRVFVEKQNRPAATSGAADTPALRVLVWREIWRDGTLVWRELISDDTYREKELKIL